MLNTAQFLELDLGRFGEREQKIATLRNCIQLAKNAVIKHS